MKKLIAILLSLVMCLSIGMTALAADDVVDADDVKVDGTSTVTDNEANTNVDILVETANINCTVPLDVTIVALVNGGTCYVPDGYEITNNSLIPVKVVNIKATVNNTEWTLASAEITANAAPATAGVNDLYMTVNGVSLATAIGTDGLDLTTPWEIAAANDSDDTDVLDLPLAASSSMLDTITAVNNAITVVYTIEAV